MYTRLSCPKKIADASGCHFPNTVLYEFKLSRGSRRPSFETQGGKLSIAHPVSLALKRDFSKLIRLCLSEARELCTLTRRRANQSSRIFLMSPKHLVSTYEVRKRNPERSWDLKSHLLRNPRREISPQCPVRDFEKKTKNVHFQSPCGPSCCVIFPVVLCNFSC